MAPAGRVEASRMIFPVDRPPVSWKPSPGGSVGAPRPDGRRHTAVDFPAELGDDVVAPAAGVVVGATGWDGPGQAVYLATASGTWILAPLEVAVDVGDAVAEGQLLGWIVAYGGGSRMLHAELWAVGSAGKNNRPRWDAGQPRPVGLLDPWLALQGAPQARRQRQIWPWLLSAGLVWALWR